MALLGFELLFRLTWGLLVGVVFVRRTESSEKFVKIAARFAWGLGLTAAIMLWSADLEPLSSGLGSEPDFSRQWGALFSLAMLVGGFQLYTSVYAVWGRFAGFAVMLLAPILLAGAQLSAQSGAFPAILNTYSSGLLLGGFFAGQFLGHWYLNVPGMHIVELKRVMKFLFAGLIVKTLEVGYWLSQRFLGDGVGSAVDAMGRPLGDDISNTEFLLQLNPNHSVFSLEGDLWLGLGSYGLILLSMRVLWGVIAPWVLALMIQKTVNMRSTQSATGILYAACVMVLVAEATALYLGQVLGINL